MTDENMAVDDDGVDWGNMQDPEAVATWTPDDVGTKMVPTYPEYPDLPEARFSLNMAPDKPPMVTVRAQTATEMTAALNELEAGGVYANIAAAYASLRAQGTVGAGLGPVTPVTPQAPPPGLPTGPPQTPQTPPPFGPNVSAPQAPNYQGPPPQQYAQAAPQSGGWGGSGGSGGNKAQPVGNPGGWYKTNARNGPGFDAWKAMRENGKDYVKGKIKWAGGPEYWVSPDIAGWVSQQGWPIAQ